ncbi:25315_t:CDS:2, partial [Racocetra persica]
FYAFIWLLIAISMILNVISATSNTNSIALIKSAPKHSWNEIVQFNRDYLTFRYGFLTRGSDQYALNKLASAEKRSKSVNFTRSDTFGYYGQVAIGGQKFDVMIDIVGSDLLVPSVDCWSTEVDGILGEDNLLVGGIKSDQIF